MEEPEGYLILGGVDLPFAFAIPAAVIEKILGALNKTMAEDKVDYWHLRLLEPTPDSFALAVPFSQPLALDIYRVPLT